MASVISHPAVPLGLALALGSKAVPGRLVLLGVACSALPDVDAVGLTLGIPYGHLLGHRGLTHSIAFAFVVALVSALLLRLERVSPPTVALFIFVSTVSHGLLDAMTTGGRGIAFFSPFSNSRYFLPWRVILVSPIGITSFFSERGLGIVGSELRWVWLPSIAIGLTGLALRKRTSAA